jgi:hypothetical protein
MSFFKDLKSKVETFVEELPQDLSKAEAEIAVLENKVSIALPKVEALLALAEKEAPKYLPYIEEILSILKVV